MQCKSGDLIIQSGPLSGFFRFYIPPWLTIFSAFRSQTQLQSSPYPSKEKLKRLPTGGVPFRPTCYNHVSAHHPLMTWQATCRP